MDQARVLPALTSGSCLSLKLTKDRLAGSNSCMAQNGVLLVEFWGLGWGFNANLSRAPPAAISVLDDVVVGAASGAAPVLALTRQDGLVASPALGKTAPAVIAGGVTYYDRAATERKRPYHRIEVPVGLLARQADAQDWFITIANLNGQGRVLGAAVLRAQCVTDSAPCPSATPGWGPCSSVWWADPAPTCRASSQIWPRTRVCRDCPPGWAGISCATPFTNLTAAAVRGVGPGDAPAPRTPLPPVGGGNASDGVSLPPPRLGVPGGIGVPLSPLPETLGIGSSAFNVSVPPRGWVHFWFNVPDGPLASVLVEAWQPPGSGPLLDPVVVLKPAVTRVIGTALQDGSLPDLSDINFASAGYVNVPQSYVYLPRSRLATPSQSPGPFWLSVFNAAPPAWADGGNGGRGGSDTDVQAPPPVTLRIQIDPGVGDARDSPRPSAPLCPADCSGAGTCVFPPANTGVFFACACDPGRTGQYCEGRSSAVNLQAAVAGTSAPASLPTATYLSGRRTLDPGAWDFYLITLDPVTWGSGTAARTGGRSLSVALQVEGASPVPLLPSSLPAPQQSSAVGGAGSGPVFMVVSPYYPGSSVGDAFFDAKDTFAFASSVQLRLGQLDLALSSSFVVAVYLADVAPTQRASYALTMWSGSLPAALNPDGSPASGSDAPSPGSGGSGSRAPGSRSWGASNPMQQSTWYVGFIAAMAGSAVLAIACFVMVRLLQRRLVLGGGSRWWWSSGAGAWLTGRGGADGAGAEPGNGNAAAAAANVRAGVPASVLACFPTLTFTTQAALDAELPGLLKAASAALSLLVAEAEAELAGAAAAANAEAAAEGGAPADGAPAANAAGEAAQQGAAVELAAIRAADGAGNGAAAAEAAPDHVVLHMGGAGAADSSAGPAHTDNHASHDHAAGTDVEAGTAAASMRAASASSQRSGRNAALLGGATSSRPRTHSQDGAAASPSTPRSGLLGGPLDSVTGSSANALRKRGGGRGAPSEAADSSAAGYDGEGETASGAGACADAGGSTQDGGSVDNDHGAAAGDAAGGAKDGDQLGDGSVIDSGACCSVCLADTYDEGDVVRALVPCGHVFHQACIDPWLTSRDTCPMCRAELVPRPLLAQAIAEAEARRAARRARRAAAHAAAAAGQAREAARSGRQGRASSRREGRTSRRGTSPMLLPVTAVTVPEAAAAGGVQRVQQQGEQAGVELAAVTRQASSPALDPAPPSPSPTHAQQAEEAAPVTLAAAAGTDSPPAGGIGRGRLVPGEPPVATAGSRGSSSGGAGSGSGGAGARPWGST